MYLEILTLGYTNEASLKYRMISVDSLIALADLSSDPSISWVSLFEFSNRVVLFVSRSSLISSSEDEELLCEVISISILVLKLNSK